MEIESSAPDLALKLVDQHGTVASLHASVVTVSHGLVACLLAGWATLAMTAMGISPCVVAIRGVLSQMNKQQNDNSLPGGVVVAIHDIGIQSFKSRVYKHLISLV